jgi:hypothetical protein
MQQMQNDVRLTGDRMQQIQIDARRTEDCIQQLQVSMQADVRRTNEHAENTK